LATENSFAKWLWRVFVYLFKGRQSGCSFQNEILIPIMQRIIHAFDLSFVACAVALDGATMDRERVLKAAGAALDTQPIMIAELRAKLSEGVLNDSVNFQ